MSILHDLAELGQAVWLDYIRRSFITSGELKNLVEDGLLGVTSNPSIFEKAISGSTDYDAELHQLVHQDKSLVELYEILAIEDIRLAAEVLRPVYDATGGVDGYVSLEVRPELANDTEGTVEEARRLFSTVGLPNLMIKVPATNEGIPAIESLISEGISVNATLLFSLSHYEKVAEAYVSGLEKFDNSGGDLSKVSSVASFFISRVDSAVDRELEKLGEQGLMGKAAIANAKLANARFEEIFHGARWEALEEKGAKVQRLLWASTSTKNPQFPDTLYVDELIGPNTVNTVPPATLKLFMKHGTVKASLGEGLDDAHKTLDRLAQIGIDTEAITQKLQDDGVGAFAQSFTRILTSLSNKQEQLLAGWQPMRASLNKYEANLQKALDEITEQDILARIWNHDHTVWKQDPTEITNRLGWLHSPELMKVNLGWLDELRSILISEGFEHIVLLGMGGSSLAPEFFMETFGVNKENLSLSVLDSTDPASILDLRNSIDLERTVFIVATKSGGTVETLSFFKYFYNQVIAAVDDNTPGGHFIAITDPGSKLEDIARHFSFRETFLNDPNIGGRYSALSFFGLVPAALIGVDVRELLERAHRASVSCDSCVQSADNPGIWLGAILGELAKAGRDKVTFITSPKLSSFGDWVEQLIAESTGKEGVGILPVVGEPIGSPETYLDDRLFIYLRLDGDTTHDAAVEHLEKSGQPVVHLQVNDLYDLGGQIFIWELAIAIASQRLEINPFDQPNVESAKIIAREKVEEYERNGKLASDKINVSGDGIDIYLSNGRNEPDLTYSDPGEAMREFLSEHNGRGYVTVQAYVHSTPEVDNALLGLRKKLFERTKLATTLGYGPRFLHSTGQLHKGDAGNGLFIQLTADDPEDVPIPLNAGDDHSEISFGVLKAAQAQGDREALVNAGRKVIRIHLGQDLLGGLDKVLSWIS